MPVRLGRRPAPVSATARDRSVTTVPQHTPPASAAGAPGCEDWRLLVERMQLKGVLRELAMNCGVKQRDDSHWLLVLDSSHQQLLSQPRQQRLQEAVSQCLCKPVRLDIEVTGSAVDTPALQQRAEAEMRQGKAVDIIESDPNVKAIQKAFDAILHADSIRPLDS